MCIYVNVLGFFSNNDCELYFPIQLLQNKEIIIKQTVSYFSFYNAFFPNTIAKLVITTFYVFHMISFLSVFNENIKVLYVTLSQELRGDAAIRIYVRLYVNL